MVNVNVQLPPIVAAPFPQASEALHRENLLQPAIPKTERSHAYAKMRDHQDRENVAHQSNQIIQKESTGEKSQGQPSSFNQRRDHFFATKLKLSPFEVEKVKTQLTGITDYKGVISVIQKKYSDAVSPLPSPTVSYSV
jgi:hypothetical protein